MTKGEKVIVTIAVATLVLVVSLLFVKKSQSPIVGNTSQADALQSTTTSAMTASVGSFRMLACGTGMLGSVIIENETLGSFNFYDATTTRNGAIYGTTTLPKIYPSLAEGTYDYNIFFKTGLVMEHQSTNIGSSTITFKGNPTCN